MRFLERLLDERRLSIEEAALAATALAALGGPGHETAVTTVRGVLGPER